MLRPALLVGALASCLALAASPARAGLGEGYVGSSTSNDAHPFNLVTLVEGGRLDLGGGAPWYPYDATITRDGLEVWVAGASGDEIAIIDRATDTIVDRIPVGEYPVSVEFSLDGALAFVGCRDAMQLDVVDTATRAVLYSLPLSDQAGQIGVDPQTGLLYVAAWYDSDLWKISADGSLVLDTLAFGAVSLWSVRVAPDGARIYVTDRRNDVVRVIDVATFLEVTTVVVGDDPWGLDVSEDGSKLVVACEDSRELRVIDTSDLSSVAVALDVDADPRDVDIHESEWEAFVPGGKVPGALGEEHLVYVLDLATNTLVGSYDSGGTNTNVIAVWPSEPAACGPDSDGDGVGDDCDQCPGYDDNLDNDSDGVPDECDVCEGFDDASDADGDGEPDGCDLCPFDPTNADTDRDSVCDDGDGSGVAGDNPCPVNDPTQPGGCDDNCPDDSNYGDSDSDSDGSGDACDPCPGFDDALDFDGDGVPDGCDICPWDPTNADTDGDEVCDDGDGSGVAGDNPCSLNDATQPDGCDDNCPDDPNYRDDDSDADGSGDACDLCPGFDDALDDDGDTVPTGCDNCPGTFNPAQDDADGNGIGDACEAPVACTNAPEATGLRVSREGDDLVLSFDRIDPSRTESLNLHAGTLAGLAAGSYDHASRACALLGTSYFDAGAASGPDAYYLLVGHCTTDGEGSYGRDSRAVERPSTADLGTMSCP